MVGFVGVEPCVVKTPQILPSGHTAYSHYIVQIGDLVWKIAISPAVRSIKSVRKLSGVGNLDVVIVYEINGKIFQEHENLNLGLDARRVLCSKEVLDLLKRVRVWKLDE